MGSTGKKKGSQFVDYLYYNLFLFADLYLLKTTETETQAAALPSYHYEWVDISGL